MKGPQIRDLTSGEVKGPQIRDKTEVGEVRGPQIRDITEMGESEVTSNQGYNRSEEVKGP